MNKKFNFLIKYPSRERPQQFFDTLDKYVQLFSGANSYQIVVSLDDDDSTMNNDQVRSRLKKYPQLTYYFGNSLNKIDAVNRDLDKHRDFDILLLASDDMVPEKSGYDEVIANQFRLHFPDLDGVTWFNDGYQGENINTLCILGKKYYDRFGYIYHPDYCSLFSDNEFTDVANMLDRQVYSDEVIIRHRHYVWTAEVSKDELYARNDMFSGLDGQVYQTRKGMNFGLSEQDMAAMTRVKDRKGVSGEEELVNEEFKADSPLWSILICTLESRFERFGKLYGKIQQQITALGLKGQVEVLYHRDNGGITVGKKRNELMEMARGAYVCFVDDDDDVHDKYIEIAYRALLGKPDVVMLQGIVTTGGKDPRTFIHSISHQEYRIENNVYLRPPNHLNVMKREVACQFRFPETSFEEDKDWAMQVCHSGLLKTECSVTIPLYYYKFDYEDSATYKFKKTKPTIDLTDAHVINSIIWGD